MPKLRYWHILTLFILGNDIFTDSGAWIKKVKIVSFENISFQMKISLIRNVRLDSFI